MCEAWPTGPDAGPTDTTRNLHPLGDLDVWAAAAGRSRRRRTRPSSLGTIPRARAGRGPYRELARDAARVAARAGQAGGGWPVKGAHTTGEPPEFLMAWSAAPRSGGRGHDQHSPRRARRWPYYAEGLRRCAPRSNPRSPTGRQEREGGRSRCAPTTTVAGPALSSGVVRRADGDPTTLPAGGRNRWRR